MNRARRIGIALLPGLALWIAVALVLAVVPENLNNRNFRWLLMGSLTLLIALCGTVWALRLGRERESSTAFDAFVRGVLLSSLIVGLQLGALWPEQYRRIWNPVSTPVSPP